MRCLGLERHYFIQPPCPQSNPAFYVDECIHAAGCAHRRPRFFRLRRSVDGISATARRAIPVIVAISNQPGCAQVRSQRFSRPGGTPAVTVTRMRDTGKSDVTEVGWYYLHPLQYRNAGVKPRSPNQSLTLMAALLIIMCWVDADALRHGTTE